MKEPVSPAQMNPHLLSKKRLIKFLTSRLFIIAVLTLIQLAVLLFILVKVSTMRYWVSIALHVFSFIMVLCILPREDNPSSKLSWIILIMAVPLIGGMFYLCFGMKRNSKKMAQQMQRYSETVLHRDHAQSCQERDPEECLHRLRSHHPTLARQANYIYQNSGFELYQNTEAEYFSLGEKFYAQLVEELEKAEKFILM